MRVPLILLCALYVICQLLWISLMFCFQIFSFFYLAFVLCFFLFTFASKSCLWPFFFVLALIMQVQVFILGFSFWFLPNFRFLFLFFIFRLWLLPGFRFLFLPLTSCFWLLLNSHFSLLSFIFRLWVKAHYGGPKVIDVVFIINPFHSVKLESLFQNRKHPPLKVKICGFQERPPSKILHTNYLLKCNLTFINVWISRTKFNSQLIRFHKIFKYSFVYELIHSKSRFMIPFHQKKGIYWYSS